MVKLCCVPLSVQQCPGFENCHGLKIVMDHISASDRRKIKPDACIGLENHVLDSAADKCG